LVGERRGLQSDAVAAYPGRVVGLAAARAAPARAAAAQPVGRCRPAAIARGSLQRLPPPVRARANCAGSAVWPPDAVTAKAAARLGPIGNMNLVFLGKCSIGRRGVVPYTSFGIFSDRAGRAGAKAHYTPVHKPANGLENPGQVQQPRLVSRD